MRALLGGSAVVAGDEIGGEVVSEMADVIFVPIVVEVRQLEPYHTHVVMVVLQPGLVVGHVWPCPNTWCPSLPHSVLLELSQSEIVQLQSNSACRNTEVRYASFFSMHRT